MTEKPDNDPKESGITQTMTDSPGGMQAARDIIIQSDRRLINSLVLRVSTEIEGKVTSGGTHAGLGSALGLFTQDKTRFRFATDYMIHDQQASPTTRQLNFVYTPETPSEILGREIHFLNSIKVLVVNYADIFRALKFATNQESVTLQLTVELNGLAAGTIRSVASPGVLSSGQATVDVSELFRHVPLSYEKAVSR
jgi:hypothetical protein